MRFFVADGAKTRCPFDTLSNTEGKQQYWRVTSSFLSSSLAEKLAELTVEIDAALLKGIIFRHRSETSSVPPPPLSFVCSMMYAKAFFSSASLIELLFTLTFRFVSLFRRASGCQSSARPDEIFCKHRRESKRKTV